MTRRPLEHARLAAFPVLIGLVSWDPPNHRGSELKRDPGGRGVSMRSIVVATGALGEAGQRIAVTVNQ